MDTCKSMDVAAALSEHGMGITLLPNICYQDKIDAGKLRVLKAEPRFPPVEFYAIYARNSTTMLAQNVARISREVRNISEKGIR